MRREGVVKKGCDGEEEMDHRSLSVANRRRRKNDGDDPEANDHRRFLPADQFEMMMQRRHGENPFARQLEAGDLNNDRERFHDENAADEDQQQFLFTTDGNHGDETADGQRTGVAHEHLGRVRIEPQKS